MRYQGIQALRGLAVLFVIWRHIRLAGDFSEVLWIKTTVGAVGVDIFFVISGFIIALNSETNAQKPLRFAINRFSRVIPIYWLASYYFATAQWFEGNVYGLFNTFFFLPIFDTLHFTNPVHDFGWTLCFEVWFYLLFTICIFIAKDKAWLVLVTVLSLGCVIVDLFYTQAYYLPNFLFHPLTLEFVCGILIFKAQAHFTRQTFILSTIATLLLFIQVFFTQQLAEHNQVLSDKPQGFLRLVFWGGLGVMSVIAAVTVDRLALFTWPTWLVYLGEKSFSIYLFQPYSIVLLGCLDKYWVIPGLWRAAIFVIATLLFGILASKLIEFPLMRIVRKYLESRALHYKLLKQ
jgi:exopolysaccharide production protein ExoZ